MSSILIKISITSFVLISVLSQNGLVESRNDRIKLKNIEVLTLNSGKWTTGRRTSPVPQLQCAGGYCNQFKPQTVQCYNRGSDGVDIQWECKTEMPQKYKFGQIDVICEGYDYPEDDYVLVGSCGLEYTLDLTEKDSYSSNHHQNYDNTYRQPYKPKASNSSFGFILCVIAIIFIIYYTCLRPNGHRGNRSSTGAPPPPGFRSDFYDEGCSSTSTGYSSFTNDNTNRRGANDGNGFLTGALTGGILGYLFGSRTNSTNYSDQSSYFGSRANPPPPYFSSGSQSSSSDSSRTTSGFGGTKRR